MSFLSKMLERLYASLASGPSINCRPHRSRQRVDLTQLRCLEGPSGVELLATLLGPTRKVKLTAPLASLATAVVSEEEGRPVELSSEEKARRKRGQEQATLIRKLATIAEDALDFENETGAQALFIGLQLLHIPPGQGRGRQATSRTILAPVGFVPIQLRVKRGRVPAVELEAAGTGMDLLVANPALVAWAEQQSGKKLGEVFADEGAEDPWRELGELTAKIGELLEVPPTDFGPTTRLVSAPGGREILRPPLPLGEGKGEGLRPIEPAPERESAESTQQIDLDSHPTERIALGLETTQKVELNEPTPGDEGSGADPAQPEREPEPGARFVPAAVLGLFPLSNLNLIHDTEALASGESLVGPIESFLRSDVSLAPSTDPQRDATVVSQRTTEERLVSAADPCQANAVRLARTAKGLVVHGPPGTGKSQTITNAIGDHLARGERVLVVCDKRTALDVVKFRLEALGLGQLCAVVHDAQRDQRDLYLSLRDQLETLPETKLDGSVEKALEKVDRELQEVYDSLREHDRALTDSSAGPSFHSLVGQWLGISVAPEPLGVLDSAREVSLDELERHSGSVEEVFGRGESARYPSNPWRDAIGDDLAGWMARSIPSCRSALDSIVQVGRAVDSIIPHPGPLPEGEGDLSALDPQLPLSDQASARRAFAASLRSLASSDQSEPVRRWAMTNPAEVEAARGELEGLGPHVEVLRSGPLDPELSALQRAAPLPLPEVFSAIGRLDAYLRIARRWFWFFFVLTWVRASGIARRFGLSLSADAAERLQRFLSGVRARHLLSEWHRRALPEQPAREWADAPLRTSVDAHAQALSLMRSLSEPTLAPIASTVRAALGAPARHLAIAEALERSATRAEALIPLEAKLAECEFLSSRWRGELCASVRGGSPAAPVLQSLLAEIGTVESLLRIEAALAAMPGPLTAAVRSLLERGTAPARALPLLRREVLHGELSRRIASTPVLRAFDGDKLERLHARAVQLEEEKRGLVRATILARWNEKQRSRLLASTGGRLNGAGAELKRRLLVRGARVLKVRQVIAAGLSSEGGDALFDLRPVWMASPETVSQIFPRLPLFDVVIFDESSQCRLEQAIPVLTRGKRVVVAGDPKQLPPTRFFESTVAQSEGEEPETEQEFFEERQAEVEDLLGAALNLEIEQAYLDVHYRSQNGDLIEFSNRHFYDSRLQAIPGHPSNRVELPPLELLRVDGTYEKRVNRREAEEVVRLTRELLAQPEPPSIGIACFNLNQREAILDALDEAAAEDALFATRLATARARRGAGSFEGLFVKNLENVQGDERDHMIISTTYGPDVKGRFYRRFGPLGMPGGGRRLNVLVTRARKKVHLISSIPREVYASLPPLDPAQAPSGSWLLYAYLQFAEQLAAEYGAGREENQVEVAEAPLEAGEDRAASETPLARSRVEDPSSSVVPSGFVDVVPVRRPSPLAESLARTLAAQFGISSQVHWGNEGFCVDLALLHPRKLGDVTLGVLCDRARYDKATDAVEWDLFRTEVLRGQGWELARLWSPELFRDPQASYEQLLAKVGAKLAAQPVAAGGVADSRRVVH